jgi:hypothetical protein
MPTPNDDSLAAMCDAIVCRPKSRISLRQETCQNPHVEYTQAEYLARFSLFTIRTIGFAKTANVSPILASIKTDRTGMTNRQDWHDFVAKGGSHVASQKSW